MANRGDPSKGTNIQVLVRCRPPNADEVRTRAPQVVVFDEERREVSLQGMVAGRRTERTFAFDKVFGQGSTQADLFRDGVLPLVHEVLEGYNCTIFAYGQTGTGKTYTMEGDLARNQEGELPIHAGVIPRAVNVIFDSLKSQFTEYTVSASFLEIYNEELTDLLALDDILPSKAGSSGAGEKKLKIMEDGKTGVVVQDLKEEIVTNADEIFVLLARGTGKRTKAATFLNKQSSRSHSVFTLKIHVKEVAPDGQEFVRLGKLNLVDLAGSENVGRSGAKEKRAREAGEINKSLLTLGRCINSLVENQLHIPFRESKLTRLLQESLGGRAKTCIIATVGPTAAGLEETNSTLEYAYRAKSIKNKPEVNQKVRATGHFRELNAEIERLKAELFLQREKGGIYVTVEQFEHDKNLRAELQQRVAELERNLKSQNQIMDQRAQQHKREKEQLQQTLETERASAQQQLAVKEAEKIAQLQAQKEQFEAEIVDINEAHAAVVRDKDAVIHALNNQLHQTQDKLATTTRQLNDTEGKLVAANKTIEKRDVTINQLKDAESRLASMSHYLRKEVETAATDIGGLFDKIDRMGSLDKSNTNTRHLFRTSVLQQTTLLMSHMSETVEQVQATKQKTCDAVEAARQRKLEAITVQRETLQRLENIMADGLASLEAQVNSSVEKDHTSITNAEKYAQTLLEDVKKTVAAAKDTADERLQELNAEIEEADGFQLRMLAGHMELSERATASMTAVLTQIEEAVAKLHEEAGRIATLFKDAVEQQKGVHQRYNDDRRQRMTALVEDFKGMLERVVKAAEDDETKTNDFTGAARFFLSEKCEKAAAHASCITATSSDLSAAAAATAQAAVDSARQGHSQLQSLQDGAQQHLAKVKGCSEQLVTGFSSSLKAIEESSHTGVTSFLEETKSLSSSINMLSSTVASNSAETKAASSQEKNYVLASLQEESTSDAAALDFFVTSVDILSRTMTSAAGVQTEGLNLLADQTTNFANRDTLAYVNSGKTPKKRPLVVVSEDDVEKRRFRLSPVRGGEKSGKCPSPSPAKVALRAREGSALGDISNMCLT